jgi:hypothetical protein
MATSGDLKVDTEETEKLSKYKDLEIEGSRMWENEDKNSANYNCSIRKN